MADVSIKEEPADVISQSEPYLQSCLINDEQMSSTVYVKQDIVVEDVKLESSQSESHTEDDQLDDCATNDNCIEGNSLLRLGPDLGSTSSPEDSSQSAREDETVMRKKRKRKASTTLNSPLESIVCAEGAESESDLEEEAEWPGGPPSVEGEHCSSSSSSSSSDRYVPSSMQEEGAALQWHKVDFQPPEHTEWRDTLTVDAAWHEQPPLFFFHLMFDDDLIEHIVRQTRRYALQHDGRDLRMQTSEMKSFLGILLLTGIIKVPSYRTYWKRSLRIDPIADALSRDRFEDIKSFLHFNDNTLQTAKDLPEFDKLHKIRPVVEAIQRNCRSVPQEEHQSIDEQIIPTKDKSSLRQDNAEGTRKSGYRLVCRAGSSGLVYDFEVHTGRCSEGGVVSRLAEGIPKHRNYKLFTRPPFSSVRVAGELKEAGIWSVSEVGANRVEGSGLKEERELRREGRGSVDHSVETTNNAVAVKWLDEARCLVVVSTYAGVQPLAAARRWDAGGAGSMEARRPHAVAEYNKFKGGVEVSDLLLGLYRIDFKAKKWYVRMFLHLLDLSVVNAWLLYRRACEARRARFMGLSDFKEDVAMSLMAPAGVGERGLEPAMRRRQRQSNQPADSARHDGAEHWPACTAAKQRCKECVRGLTRVECVKCRVGLCLTKDRNCFIKYHCP